MNLKSLAFLSVSLLLIGTFLAFQISPVAAETEVEQEQSQELKVKCQAGSYGQTSYCEAEGQQEQKQRVVVRDRVLGVTHEPVNTGLDLKTGLTAAGAVLSGAGALVVKRKI